MYVRRFPRFLSGNLLVFLSHIKPNTHIAVTSVGKCGIQIKEYVTLHVEKNLTVKSVAEHFGYHENHVSRIFKNTYGILLKAYIDEQRLEYTRALLTTTLYTVSQIAQMASFKSDNHFIKFFKYHTRLTPTAYRNTYINTHVNQA